ncbi:MAG: tRNA 2-thiocytidine biosynthesis protein TtcA [Candidatus Malacoplasma girerdii]|nr:MAG: tRNA 2-thiocytidine biosynthesis protein TtcA [Candidatus Malacoplasma girerdii]
MRRIIGSILKANEMFKLFNKNDKVAVAVSGGKDSSVLLWALALFAKKMNEQHGWNMKIYGIHIKVDFYDGYDYQPFLNWIKKVNLDLRIIPSNVADILYKKAKNGKVICSFCAKMKKAILIREAKKLGCNKLATGHHIDDAIETLFLNMIYEGRMATFPAKMYLDRTKSRLIRPLILANEKDIIAVSKKYNIPVMKNMCPNETSTQRTYLKIFLEKHFYNNKLFPNVYANFRNSLMNNKQSSLWFFKPTKKSVDLLEQFKANHIKHNK